MHRNSSLQPVAGDLTELEWQACLYVLDELPPAERAEFELRLADDHAAQQSLVTAVSLCMALGPAAANLNIDEPIAFESNLAHAQHTSVQYGSVQPLGGAVPASTGFARRLPMRRSWVAAAAAVLLAAGVGVLGWLDREHSNALKQLPDLLAMRVISPDLHDTQLVEGWGGLAEHGDTVPGDTVPGEVVTGEVVTLEADPIAISSSSQDPNRAGHDESGDPMLAHADDAVDPVHAFPIHDLPSFDLSNADDELSAGDDTIPDWLVAAVNEEPAAEGTIPGGAGIPAL